MPQSQDADRDMLSLDVGPGITIGDLKAVIAADTQIAANLQVLFHNGNPLADSSQTLEALRVIDGDMLVMQARRVQQGAARARPQPQAQRVRDDAEILRLQALGEPRIMNQLRQHNPELANAVQDQRQFREIWNQMIRTQQEAEEEKHRMMESLAADPFDMETQKKIEELIRENAVMQNITEAMEHTPEGNLGSFTDIPPWCVFVSTVLTLPTQLLAGYTCYTFQFKSTA